MQNILIPNLNDFLLVLNSYVCRIRQSIPNGIPCSKKAVHLLQRRCRRISQASLVSTLVQSIPNWNTLFKKGSASAAAQMLPHSTGITSQYHTLIPYTPPGVKFLYVGHTLCYFCPLRSSYLDKSKTSYQPPPLPPHRLCMQDPRFVSSPYVCMQNILIPDEYDFLLVLNSILSLVVRAEKNNTCQTRHTKNKMFRYGKS